MVKKNEVKRFLVSLPIADYDALKIKAKDDGRTVSSFVRISLQKVAYDRYMK